MGRQAPDGLLGIHTNLAAVFPPDAAEAIDTGAPAPEGLSEKERAEFDALEGSSRAGDGLYLTMMSSRPQAVGYGLTDSPAGLAAIMLVHGGFGQWTYGKDPNQTPTKDEVLDDISLYWLTNTATSAARLYWENRNENLISAAARRPTRSRSRWPSRRFRTTICTDLRRRGPRAFPNLIYFNEAEAGGHFPAWEVPDEFATEVRAAFRSLR